MFLNVPKILFCSKNLKVVKILHKVHILERKKEENLKPLFWSKKVKAVLTVTCEHAQLQVSISRIHFLP